MVELCRYLSVSNASSSTGAVIEQCGEFNGELGDFALVLEQDQVPLLKDWIARNIRHNADHCVQMLDNDAKATFNFLKRMCGIQSCTSEFVKDAGGIQEFLDEYSARIAPTVEPAEPAELSEPAEPAEPVATPVAPAEPVATPVAPDEPVATPVEPVESAESVAAPVEPVVQPASPVVQSRTVVQEEIIHRKVSEVQDYDPALIESISDGQIAESVAKLKALNDQIALGGLDPKFVLSDSDLEEIYKKIYTYPPEVFKSFILAYLKSVNSETERYRISAVMDDFMKFIEG